MYLKTHTIVFFVGLLLYTEAFSMEWTTANLIITDIQGNRGGQICVYIFLDDGFPVKHDKALRNTCYDATESSMEVELQVPDEAFAIKVHHDEDRSGTVTKNWTGFIPAEGLGFSSGAKLGFGPPSFEQAMLFLSEDEETEISMTYP